jgi:hypothetical protein
MRFGVNAPSRLTLVAVCGALSACGGSRAAISGRAGGSAGSQSAPARAGRSAIAVPDRVRRDAERQARKLSPALVATVAGEPVTKAQFDAAYAPRIAAMPVGRPDAPPYKHCVALLKSHLTASRTEAAPKLPAPSDSSLRSRCAQRGPAARQGAMMQLIQAAWTQREARPDHIVVSDDDVSDADAARYFDQHRPQFGLPERRNIEVILAKTQKQAQLAKRAVRNGMVWEAAAVKWSIDFSTRASGGLLAGVAKGSQETALDGIALSARPGNIAGPVKGRRGWYLVRVTKVEAATKPELGAYKARIRLLLAQQLRAQLAGRATAAYERRWRARTVCRRGYVVPLCANAPAGRPKQRSR